MRESTKAVIRQHIKNARKSRMDGRHQRAMWFLRLAMVLRECCNPA